MALDKSEIDYSIQKALRNEFETCDKERMLQIYQTSKQLKYDEQAEEMASDIEFEFNINLND